MISCTVLIKRAGERHPAIYEKINVKARTPRAALLAVERDYRVGKAIYAIGGRIENS